MAFSSTSYRILVNSFGGRGTEMLADQRQEPEQEPIMIKNESDAGALSLDFTIDRKDTALLVVDIQNGFCHKDSAMARAGIDTTRQPAVVPNIVRIVRLCRAAGLRILSSGRVQSRNGGPPPTGRLPLRGSPPNYFPCLR